MVILKKKLDNVKTFDYKYEAYFMNFIKSNHDSSSTRYTFGIPY